MPKLFGWIANALQRVCNAILRKDQIDAVLQEAKGEAK